MAVSIGGGIVKDGLVFHLTQNNINAYRGKPTTNLFTANPDGWGQRPAADKTILTDETYRGGTIYRLADADGVTYGTYVDNYIGQSFTHSTTAGTGFTLSFDCRPITRSGVAKTPYQNCVWVWYSSNSQVVYFDDLPLNEWTHVTITCQSSSSYTNIYPRFDYDNVIVDIANVQFEQNDFATPYAGLNGTRATTGVFYDATGNHTINAASMNYPTDGTANFTAQAHNITVDSNTFTMPLEKTLSIWIKSDRSLSATDNWEVGFVNQGSVSGSMFGFMYGVGSCQDLGYWGYGSPYDMSVESTTNKWSSDGNWHNGVITMDASRNVRVYVDGVAKQFLKHSDYTTLVDYVTMPTNTTNYFLINSRGAWSGMTYVNLDDVMVYDRALTAKEVAQNYEAGRALHGL